MTRDRQGLPLLKTHEPTNRTNNMDPKNTALALSAPNTSAAALYRQSSDIAGLCREIVVATACEIQGRKYVKVEGWMSIATAHGCMASVRQVDILDAGIRAIAEVRRMSDGLVLCTAEGYVGKDETTWYGGEVTFYDRSTQKESTKILPKRADYAIRAMAQTRAVSRACRTAFAHVVVMMQAGLETTPAEEYIDETQPLEGATAPAPAKTEDRKSPAPAAEKDEPLSKDTLNDIAKLVPQFMDGAWKKVAIHFGKNKGQTLAQLTDAQLNWWIHDWQPRPYKGQMHPDDLALRAALDAAKIELP